MRTRFLALTTGFVLLAAACGGGAQTGGTQAEGGEAQGEPITVGALFDLSGATSDVGVPYAEGVRAYVDFRNQNGGVAGRPIELLWNDYAYEVPQAEQFYSQYISEGAVAIQGWGTGDTEALRTKVTSDQVPFMSASYSEALINPEETPYNFVPAASYSQQMRVALQWISENADGRAEVSVFHHDSPFGLSPVADGQAYIEENGLDIGYQAYAMPSGATDYVGLLTQAQQQGVTHIVVQNVSSPAAQLVQNVASQGLDIQVICLNWCADEILTDLAGDAAEGVMGVQPWTPPSVEAPGFEDPGSVMEGDLNLHHFQGWYTMAAMAEGIGRAAQEGGEVTGESIKAALEEMPPFETGVSAPIEFTADSHAGMDGSPIFLVEGGQWTKLSDVMAP